MLSFFRKMSDISIQVGHVLTWRDFPRLLYYRARFLDHHGRFSNVVGVLPESLRDESLMTQLTELKNLLRNEYLNIVMIGRENIAPEELYVSKEQRPEVGEPVNGNGSCLNIDVGHATFDSLDESALNEMSLIVQRSQSLRFSQTDQSDYRLHIFIVYVTKTPLTETVKEEFCSKLRTKNQTNFPSDINRCDFIFLSGKSRSQIGTQISDMLEKRIVSIFHNVRSFLSQFIIETPKDLQMHENLPNDPSFTNLVKGLLRNGTSVSRKENCAFLADFTHKVVRAVKCWLILPLSVKYSLHPWLCNRLLHEIKYEEVLSHSLSETTKKGLRKLKYVDKDTVCHSKYMENDFNAKHMSKDISHKSSNRSITIKRHLKRQLTHEIVCSIQCDFKNAIAKAESVMTSMEAISDVMRKLVFEVDGYLAQSIVVDPPEVEKTPTIDIPYDLRQEILMLEGVAGVGTVYGRIEVHLDADSPVTNIEIRRQLRWLMKKHHIYEPFIVKRVLMG